MKRLVNDNAVQTTTDDLGRNTKTAASNIPLSNIQISRFNPRGDNPGDIRTLQHSLECKGVIEPICIRSIGNNKYEVVIGVRRYLALSANRGVEGFLHEGEYRIVEWSDEECVKAAFDENSERQDLSPCAEGKFLNTLATTLKSDGKKQLTDDDLEKITGLERSHVNTARTLADKFSQLPKSWQQSLASSPNCVSDHKSPNISLTHFKHVRGLLDATIPQNVRDVMNKCARDEWSARRFKQALDALKSGKRLQPKARTPGTRDPHAAPNYKKMLSGLNTAYRASGNENEIAESISALVKRVEALLKVNDE